jgi:hypothetical protein
MKKSSETSFGGTLERCGYETAEIQKAIAKRARVGVTVVAEDGWKYLRADKDFENLLRNLRQSTQRDRTYKPSTLLSSKSN